MVIIDNVLNVDVLNAGLMVGTNLDSQRAEDKGLVKNHWMSRVRVSPPDGSVAQIVFGFNIIETDSVASNEARYAASSRRGTSSDNFSSKSGSVDFHSEGARFSSIETFAKLPTIDTGSTEAGVAHHPGRETFTSSTGNRNQPTPSPAVLTSKSTPAPSPHGAIFHPLL